MPTALAYLYTSQAEVERLFSEVGVSLHTDDLADASLAAFWEEVTSEASDIVNQYVMNYYLELDLSQSYWVQRRATWICAYLLSQRRGNPALFQDSYERVLEELQMVYRGVLQIPGLPTRGDLTPSMSNLEVDPWFRVQQLRVKFSTSTGGTYSKQHLSIRFPFDWL